MNGKRGSLTITLLMTLALGCLAAAAPARAADGVWTARGLSGERIFSLAVVQASPSVVYAGARGAVYKSEDGGRTWTTLRAGIPGRARVAAIAVDPAAPETVYAGTAVGGLFRSDDGGTSWVPCDGELPGTRLNALAISSGARAALYSAMNTGVYRSADGGASWTCTSGGLLDLDVTALVASPTAGGALYAGTASAGVFKSTDGGDQWFQVDSGLDDAFVTALAIDPVAPGTLYAGTNGGVYKTTDGGNAWVAGTGFPAAARVTALAVDPRDPGRVYAGLAGGAVFQSVDGGTAWTVSEPGMPAGGEIAALAGSPGVSGSVFAGADGVFSLATGCTPVTVTYVKTRKRPRRVVLYGEGLDQIVLVLVYGSPVPSNTWKLKKAGRLKLKHKFVRLLPKGVPASITLVDACGNQTTFSYTR